jgi:hypothetical protein
MVAIFMIKPSWTSTLYPMVARRTPRLPIVKLATLVLDGVDEPEISCHVVEISEGGARAVTHVPVKVPEFLTLRFSDGAERQVRQCWAKGREMGFEFVQKKRG